ncbi:Crp/Fnr family transcriptional regulator [Bacillota bacterium Meth-B3]
MDRIPATLAEVFPCWDQLDDEARGELGARVYSRSFCRGQVLHQGAGDCAGLFLVKRGQLRVYILSEGGKEVTLYRLFAWDICLFSASCIMKNISFELHVEAEKDAEVFIVPAELFERLAKRSLPLADYQAQLMAARFSDVMWVMEQILFVSLDSRLAGFLLEQSAIERSDEINITHEEIARHLGSAREVVTKMLHYLAGEGMVRLQRGRVTLVDRAKLEALAPR